MKSPSDDAVEVRVMVPRCSTDASSPRPSTSSDLPKSVVGLGTSDNDEEDMEEVDGWTTSPTAAAEDQLRPLMRYRQSRSRSRSTTWASRSFWRGQWSVGRCVVCCSMVTSALVVMVTGRHGDRRRRDDVTSGSRDAAAGSGRGRVRRVDGG